MAYLTLSDGTQYQGVSFGYEVDVIGEVIFNTGIIGYQELITDPTNVGKIINLTYPLIGNYGVNKSDVESDSSKIKGIIVREFCEVPSNWRCEGSIIDYLKDNKIVALCGIDTRALTRKLRDCGSMPGIISQDKPTPAQMESVRQYETVAPLELVSVKETYAIEGNGKTVAVIDYGAKRSLLKNIENLGYSLKVYPHDTDADTILADKPCGLFLTSGPGDPAKCKFEIEQIAKLIGKLPIFAVGLGHQLLALAHGAETEKLKFGHHGSNYPVRDIALGRVVISGQNHDYVVKNDGIEKFGKVSHLNINDATVEGIVYNDGISFSVQYDPMAMPGPAETNYTYEKFKGIIDEFAKEEN